MKIVIQVVKNASATLNNEVIASINQGEVLLVGFKDIDDELIVDKMIEKLLKLRIFEDENGKTNLSIFDKDGEILALSQFTLYGDVYKNNRPSFTSCLGIDKAKSLFEYFKKRLKEKYSKTSFGIFQEHLEISLVNDGPFTLILDSESLKYHEK